MGYHCSACGHRTPKWMGFCPQCRHDSALIRDDGGRRPRSAPAQVVPLVALPEEKGARVPSGMGEVDRVLGGGFVAGSAVIVGGEPGVGKSTLLLQIAHGAASRGRVMVASAEESLPQVALRAARVEAAAPAVEIVGEHDVDAILAAAADSRPRALIVDSIQAVATPDLGAAAGGVSQVRECAARLIRFAKTSGTVVVMVGHVTKDGAIAGPKLLEHMADVVLYLEGEDHQGLRMLRCLKNRFGEAHQVGLLRMTGAGLEEVPDPSELLVAHRSGEAPGTVVYPAVHGRRPVLVEVQALVTNGAGSSVGRSIQGLDAGRVGQVLAVLASHGGLNCQGREIHVGVVGGLKLREPAADLPVALAVASSLTGVPLGPVAAFGEVSLTGEVRPVAHADIRRAEAARLGYPEVVAPPGGNPRPLAALIRAARTVS